MDSVRSHPAAALRSIFVASPAETTLATIHDSSVQSFKGFNADRAVEWVDNPDAADCIVLFEEWQTRFWDYAKTLAEDPFFQNCLAKIQTVNCDDVGRGFLPGCYASILRSAYDKRLHRACAFPCTYNEAAEVEPDARMDAQWLYSFRGNISGIPVRESIFRHLGSEPRGKLASVSTQFHTHSADQKREFVREVLASKFVLCPRGQGPATYRMFEVMTLGRCPVIISDQWVPIEGIAWEDAAIRIAERDVGKIPAILREHENCAERLGRAARTAWESFFSPQAKFRAMYDGLVSIYGPLREQPFDYRTRWRTWSFHYANGWLLPQRLAARVQRL